MEKHLAECQAIVVCIGKKGMGRWQLREVDVALDRQSSDENFRVIPVLLPGSEPPLGFLSQNTWVDYQTQSDLALEILYNAILNKPPKPNFQIEINKTKNQICPYRGLRYFREEDAAFFFGRDKEIETLHQKIRQHDFLAVVGASGSGKSSIVRAGLIPRLHKSKEHEWEIITLIPGKRPLHALSAALTPLLEPELNDEITRLEKINQLALNLQQGTIELRDIIERIIQKQPGTDHLLIIIDQWEELYTLTEDIKSHISGDEYQIIPTDKVCENFFEQLIAIVNEKVRIIITLRGDFVGHALESKALSDKIQDAQVNIGPLADQDLISIIEEPAKKVGLRIQEGLTKRIKSDTLNQPGSLPLLEFALESLWQERSHGKNGMELTHKSYETMGESRGAISQRAEEYYNELQDPDKQKLLQRLFLQLVRIGENNEDTRRRQEIKDLPKGFHPLINELVRRRLLVTSKSEESQSEIAEMAHEALIRNWKRLQKWLDNNREFLLWKERLRHVISEWKRVEKNNDALLTGTFLSEASHWFEHRIIDLTEIEQEFIKQSKEHDKIGEIEEEQRQEREYKQTKTLAETRKKKAIQFRNAFIIVSFFATVAVTVAIYAFILRENAVESTEETKLVLIKARKLNAQYDLKRSIDLIRKRAPDYLLAVHLLHRAAQIYLEIDERDQAYDILTTASQYYKNLPQVFSHDAYIWGFRFNKNHTVLMTWSSDGDIKLWDMVTGKNIRSFRHDRPVNDAIWNQMENLVLSFGMDGKVKIWDVDKNVTTNIFSHKHEVNSAYWNQSEDKVLTSSDDKTAKIWDISSYSAPHKLDS